jgi:hypothetical protein
MRSRLNQAAVLLLALPVYLIVMNAFRIALGGHVEPLLLGGLAYCLIAAVISAGLIKRKRGSWTSAVILSAVCTPIALYAGWSLLRSFIEGKVHPGAALSFLTAFHLAFVISTALPLLILLTVRARRELHGIQHSVRAIAGAASSAGQGGRRWG